jgi:hypothetical protein
LQNPPGKPSRSALTVAAEVATILVLVAIVVQILFKS